VELVKTSVQEVSGSVPEGQSHHYDIVVVLLLHCFYVAAHLKGEGKTPLPNINEDK
jgi:hypothetical protein